MTKVLCARERNAEVFQIMSINTKTKNFKLACLKLDTVFCESSQVPTEFGSNTSELHKWCWCFRGPPATHRANGCEDFKMEWPSIGEWNRQTGSLPELLRTNVVVGSTCLAMEVGVCYKTLKFSSVVPTAGNVSARGDWWWCSKPSREMEEDWGSW